ncbi:Glycosyl hydrolase family 81 [Ceratocystis lukuohia]|uniref:glucan endo-1,3-beta-D-glucosidase n=1 Tax=Ceratocystis lukuohia TaxID=2019550 RepID=A0ABR4MJG3_9PEZI
MPGNFNTQSLTKRFEKLMSKVESHFNKDGGSSNNNLAPPNATNTYYTPHSTQGYPAANYPYAAPPGQPAIDPGSGQYQYQQAPPPQGHYYGAPPQEHYYGAPPPPPQAEVAENQPPPIPPRPDGFDDQADGVLARSNSSRADVDVFNVALSTDAPPAVFKKVDSHPVNRLGITKSGPIGTNKFHANFFLGDQKSPVYTQPYSITWSGGKYAPVTSWGMAVSHIDANQRVFGDNDTSTGAARFFFNPVGIQSLIMSSTDLGNDTALTTDAIGPHSIMVRLRSSASAAPSISFPIVQGMGFFTGLYTGAKPVLKSAVTFRSVTRIAKSPKTSVAKWKVVLNDGKIWWVYAYCTAGSQLNFKTVSNSHIEATAGFTGVLQVAKDPGNAEAVYDKAAGVYVSSATLSGSVTGTTGKYTFSFETHGHPSGQPLGFVLPHHAETWDSATQAAATKVQLQTTVKGIATAVAARKWTFVEKMLPTNMEFAPWVQGVGSKTALSDAAIAKIREAAAEEVKQNVRNQAVLESMYYSGKALAKFALMSYVTQKMLGDDELTGVVLPKLKGAFDVFFNNSQPYPLYYESAWGGLVSSASYVTGNDGLDFGNSYYNDHHFHYGHFVLAAAIIGSLDPTWLTDARKNWVHALIRDYANPSSADPYFPQWRIYDWYHGHGWAAGLFASNDGKNQESSSEDMMSVYALRMWGVVTHNKALRDRSTLQLKVLARSIQHYYLYTSSNTVQPSNFIGNRAAGIIFENKIDHTTFFGSNIEYVNGIHMIPLLASTPLARSLDFVQTEWTQLFDNGRADEVDGGWRGILYGNLATLEPHTAWETFTDDSFTATSLDGGASLTWYLAYTAAYGGL